MIAFWVSAPLRTAGIPAGFVAVHARHAHRSLPISVAILCITLLFSAILLPKSPASGQVSEPTATEVEWLVRKAIAEGNDRLPSLLPLKGAELLKFRLVSRDRTSTTRWHVEVDLLFDYGPAPAAVLGFERFRAGRYWIVVNWTGDVFELMRFAPVGRVQPMPSG